MKKPPIKKTLIMFLSFGFLSMLMASEPVVKPVKNSLVQPDRSAEKIKKDNASSDRVQSQELLNLAQDFRNWRRSIPVGVPDYTQIVKEQRKKLREFRKRLEAINSRPWPMPAQVDYLAL